MRALAFEHLRPNPIGVYGEVLDGRGIGVDRVMLDEGEAIPDWRAYDFLVVMGAAADVWDREPWAGRARAEILAVGATAPHPHINRLERLTPLESEVALAAGTGAALDDIAHQLFLSPRSARLLEASAMAKRGVESTTELVAALGPELSPDPGVGPQATA